MNFFDASASDLGKIALDLTKVSGGALYDNERHGSFDPYVNGQMHANNISDGLHSTYHGAHKMASIVAGGMIGAGLGSAVNTSYKYTFKDSLGQTITCQAAASN